MRSLSDMTKSLGRSASLKQDQQASIPADEPRPTPTLPAQPQPTVQVSYPPSAAINVPSNLKPKAPVDDLMAIVDALARPPSQDISRPFDNIPPPRASESKSVRSKKRHSVVGNLPPTVGKLDNDLTPFGDSFKSFMQEAEPVTHHDDHKPSTSPRSDGFKSLMSSTTLSENSTSKSVSDHIPPASNMKHGSPSKNIGSYFKSFFHIKHRVTANWQPDAPGAGKAEADAPAGMHKEDPSIATIKKTDSTKGKNANNLTIPTSPTDLTGGTPPSNPSLQIPSSPNPSIKSGSIRYEHGVLLQPIVEEEAK